MTFKTHEIDVDLVNQISTKEIRFSSGDRNSAKLILNIKNEGEILDLSKAKAVRITFKKQDGKIVFQEDLNPINAMEGKYQSILKTQTLAAAGNVYGQVRIFEEDRELDAEPFVFTVKQSYSGDGAVESTNEFTIIAKALELGDKFKDVDFDPIIKAGELAKESLPKTGGTMTGELVLDGGALMRFKGSGTDPDWAFRRDDANDGFVIVPRKPDNSDWDWGKQTEFRPDNFIVNGKTNLVKTNQIYTGWLHSIGTTKQLAVGVDLNNILESGLYGGTGLKNAPNNSESQHFYIEVIQYNDAKYCLQRATTLAGPGEYATWVRTRTGSGYGRWEKLIDVKGGTLSGVLNMDAYLHMKKGNSLIFESSDPTKKNVRMLTDSDGLAMMFSKNGGAYDWDWSTVIRFGSTTNLVTKAKDGRATLTLTADATNFDTSRPLLATRRGNVVTVTGSVALNAGAASTVVSVLPTDMRPTDNITTTVVSTDGTAITAEAYNTGNLVINTKGKNVRLLMTYVVD